jgi:hypothetical protein
VICTSADTRVASSGSRPSSASSSSGVTTVGDAGGVDSYLPPAFELELELVFFVAAFVEAFGFAFGFDSSFASRRLRARARRAVDDCAI